MYLHNCNGRSSQKLLPDKVALMQWHMQARNITTNITVKVDFILPALRSKHSMTCNCHVDDSAKGTYYMILG